MKDVLKIRIVIFVVYYVIVFLSVYFMKQQLEWETIIAILVLIIAINAKVYISTKINEIEKAKNAR